LSDLEREKTFGELTLEKVKKNRGFNKGSETFAREESIVFLFLLLKIYNIY